MNRATSAGLLWLNKVETECLKGIGNENIHARRKYGTRVPQQGKMVMRKYYKKGGTVKDSCYHKVKSQYKVFPSAYASGAIAKCRKKKAGKS
jgi:hypothetical protein